MRRMVLVAAMVLMAVPAAAQGYHRGHGGHGHGHGGGGWVGPAVGGLALGAIVGGIIAGQQQQYAPPPPAYYAPPPPPVYYAPAPAYYAPAPVICRMVPYDVMPNGSTVYRQECRD